MLSIIDEGSTLNSDGTISPPPKSGRVDRAASSSATGDRIKVEQEAFDHYLAMALDRVGVQPPPPASHWQRALSFKRTLITTELLWASAAMCVYVYLLMDERTFIAVAFAQAGVTAYLSYQAIAETMDRFDQ